MTLFHVFLVSRGGIVLDQINDDSFRVACDRMAARFPNKVLGLNLFVSPDFEMGFDAACVAFRLVHSRRMS